MLQRIPEGCFPPRALLAHNKENMLDTLRILRQPIPGSNSNANKVFARFICLFSDFEWRNCLRFISFVFARLPISSERNAAHEPSTRRLHCNYRQRRAHSLRNHPCVSVACSNALAAIHYQRLIMGCKSVLWVCCSVDIALNGGRLHSCRRFGATVKRTAPQQQLCR